MPTINLRLTDEEHAALKEWALGSKRSMQREAVYRLFTTLPWTEAAREQNNLDRIAEKRRADSLDPHFKPDPKPEKPKRTGF